MSHHDQKHVANVSASIPLRRSVCRSGGSGRLIPARIPYQDWEWTPRHKPCCSPAEKTRGPRGHQLRVAQTIIVWNALATPISESMLRRLL
jgi:hypothetical protein